MKAELFSRSVPFLGILSFKFGQSCQTHNTVFLRAEELRVENGLFFKSSSISFVCLRFTRTFYPLYFCVNSFTNKNLNPVRLLFELYFKEKERLLETI